jgi:4-hydroxy 2-oxovalerate aldolase
MQATQQPDVAIASAAALVEQWKSVDVLYFADSLGDMLPVDVRQMMSLLRTNWSGPIGIHTHDNRGVALLNSLEAIDQGATWIDSTVLGMGRGAGNTKTEHLLIELVSRQYTQYDAQALFRLVLEDFSELHDKYKWGTNLLYYLAAEYSIHPTYVQQMMSLTPHISPSKIIEGIERLKEIPSLSYDAGQLERAIGGAEVDATGTCSAKDSVAGRDVLLLAGGESVGEHQQGIVDFIGRKDVFVINLNADALVPEELISAFASCHPVRAIAELDRLASLTKPVIVPLGVLPADWAKRLQASNAILDYGLKTGAQGFDFGDSSAALPRAFVALYAMAFANAGGAKRIYLAGFDGYPLGDNRQAEMIELLELYAATKGAAKLVAVTPTSYPVAQSSVYNPGA